VNPTTQVALFSIAIGNYTRIENITWNVYSGEQNSSANYSQWTLFNQQTQWFFGRNTSNFTSTNQLFLQNPNIQFWKFEVVYSFPTEISISAFNFLINQPPKNGSCFISPTNGTTTTSFQISCPDWIDEDGIKDYSVFSYDSSSKVMIAFSIVSTIEILLPSGNDQLLIIQIRDQLNCLTEYNLSSLVSVRSDFESIDNFQSSTNNPIVNLLASGNQNIIGQVLTSLSQEFNKMNTENVDKAVSSGIPAANISISSLTSQRLSSNGELNQSALIEFIKQLNLQANVREYLISFTQNLLITTSNSIKLQSSSLAQLTKATNQLSRATLSIAAERCSKLSLALDSMSTKISHEDAEIISTQLFQCASNILSAVNGPLQGRTIVLDADGTRASEFPADYDTDLESESSKINRLEDKNAYFQNQLANQIQNQMNQLISRLTSVLKIHLNTGQQSIINTSEVFMSLEVYSSKSQLNSKVLMQTKLEPLAPFGNSKSLTANTNVSRSVSLSMSDQNGNKIEVKANDTHPIEIMIPRDPNLVIPPMILQNVTSNDSTPHQQLFNLHYVNLTSSLSISIHIEIQPLDNNGIAYLLIYKFDQIPQLNDSTNQIDGWTILNSSNFNYFLDNQQTRNHHSFVFGLRELNPSEIFTATKPPIANQKFNFTSNYQLRIFTSGCYYLDENNQWKDDGLRVGPLTNYNQTQCFSTHLN